MGRLLDYLRSPGADMRIGVDAALASPVQQVDAGTWRGLLSLAGYSANQLPATVTRLDALKVPALSNGLKLLTGIAQQLPLVADPAGESDQLLKELDPDVPAGWTVARTVDALAFYGIAWWYVTSRTARGFPRTIQFVDPSRVMVDTHTGVVRIDGQPVDPADMIRFDGVTEGLLTIGAEAIRTALANVRQTRTYAEHPLPSVILTDADGAEPLEVDQARDYLAAARDAIADHGWAYLAGFKTDRVGWTAAELQLVEAREQDAVEMARLLAMPPHYLAARQGGSSLTYSNLGEVRRDLLEVGGLALYLVPVEQRLSMPDVTPRGTRVRFDADSFFLRVTPDQPTPDAAQAQANQGAPA